MKNCLTCGATVADDATVCPDCGMELDATPAFPPPVSAAPAAPSPLQSQASEGGFTVEFGADPAPISTPFPVSSAPVTSEIGGAPTPAPSTPVAISATAKITLKRGGALTAESFVVSNGAIVGRFDPESGPVDVDLAPLPEGSYVSRHHVEFRHDAGNGTWLVRDMGSRNGTFWRAGGQGTFSRLTAEQVLTGGDEISLGNARFEFSLA